MALVAGWGFYYDPATGQKYADAGGTVKLDVTGSVNRINEDPEHNYITYTPVRSPSQSQGAYKPAPPPVVAPDTRNNPGAKAYIEAALAEYGLESLAEWAWKRWLDGADIDQIMLEMRKRPEYALRFPAMKTLTDRKRAITEAEYIAYERTAAQLMRQVGLPWGFYDQPDDFARFLAGEVSISELSDRLTTYAQAVYQTPIEDREALARMYGVLEGDLLAFFIDPERAWPIIQRQWTSSQIAGAASRTGYGMLTPGEAEWIYTLGTTAQQAQDAFGRLTAMRQIFTPLPGAEGEVEVTSAEQLGATFANEVPAQEKIARQQRNRVAEFEGGGGFMGSSSGFVGVGESR